MAPQGTGRVLLSVPAAADYLGISEVTLRNWLSARQLDYVKVGRLTKISRVTLNRYIDAHTIAPRGTPREPLQAVSLLAADELSTSVLVPVPARPSSRPRIDQDRQSQAGGARGRKTASIVAAGHGFKRIKPVLLSKHITSYTAHTAKIEPNQLQGCRRCSSG